MANSNTTNVLYEALKSQLDAQRTKALATITVYLTNPVGIGEHPQILDEIVEQTKSLAEAIDCLNTLKENFEQEPPQPQPEVNE